MIYDGCPHGRNIIDPVAYRWFLEFLHLQGEKEKVITNTTFAEMDSNVKKRKVRYIPCS